jgi:flagellar protein FliJ
MATSSAIHTLIDLTTKECEKAAQDLGKSIRFGDETEKKLTLLLQYREDYAARFQVNQAEGLSITGYRNFQLFLDKLDQAIMGQQQVVRDAKRRIEISQRAWQAAEHKRMSYETLAERKRKEVQLKETRRDQKQTDEFATRQVHHKR